MLKSLVSLLGRTSSKPVVTPSLPEPSPPVKAASPNQSTPPPEAIFWIGAHKTGTTTLQDMIEQSHAALTRIGAHYIPLAMFRTLYTRPLLDNAHWVTAPNVYRRPHVATAIIFDEEVAGGLSYAISPHGLYPNVSKRLARLAGHLQLELDTVAFGIRSQDQFLVSLYAERLNFVQKFVPFRQFLNQRLGLSPDAEIAPELDRLSWTGPIQSVWQNCSPRRFIIYRHEQVRTAEAALLSAVTGLSSTLFERSVDHARPMTLSQRAVEQLEAESSADRDRIERVIATNPITDKNPRFNPWTASEQASLQELYRKDLEFISANSSWELLDLSRF